MWNCFSCKRLSIFAGGVIFGSVGLKLLSSNDAKKVYTSSLAAVLRAKDCVMETVTKVQVNAEDIMEEAKEINKEREKKMNTSDDLAGQDE